MAGHIDTAQFDELLDHIDIFNLDIHQYSKKENLEWLGKLKKREIKVIAKKIETLEQYEEYMHLGFVYFQGCFLSHPRILKGKKLETNKIAIMQLLSIFHNNESDIAIVEEALNADLTLSYKLLKLMNSAFFNLPSNVESIKRAIVLIGRKKSPVGRLCWP